MPGEDAHFKGQRGVRRAKRWLEATSRVRCSWTNEDQVASGRLTFKWPKHTEPFSFDMGGILRGEPYEAHFFHAEVKAYNVVADLGTHYDDFLAKSYLARLQDPRSTNQFMYITWHPFRVTTWNSLMEPSTVRDAVVKKSSWIFGDDGEIAVDESIVDDVARGLWIIVLSRKQEDLVMTPSDRALIFSKAIQEETW